MATATESTEKDVLSEVYRHLSEHKGCRSMRILVTGRVGVGKSSLVNSIVGSYVAEEGFSPFTRETTKVTGYQAVIKDVKVTIFDTPGLQHDDVNESEYLKDLEETCKEVDLNLYCLRMNDRFRAENEIAPMTKLSHAFGREDFWQATMFVLTFANEIILPRDQCFKSLSEYFRNQMLIWKSILHQKALIEKVSVERGVAENVPVIPAGCSDELSLPGTDCDSWLSELWLQCLDRTANSAKPIILTMNWRQLRMVGKTEMVGNKGQQDHQLPILRQGAESTASEVSLPGVNIHMPDNLQCHAKVSNGSIAGQYDLSAVISFSKNKELGRGVFATVYEGTFNNKCCAVKILNHVAIHLISDVPTGPCDDPIQSRTLQNFTRECEYLITMNHPNIVKLIGVQTYKGNFPVLIMERLDCSLTAYLMLPNLTMKLLVLSICCDIASALDYLHQQRIVHRDICSNNVLLKLNNQSIQAAKLSDFGMSEILKDFEKMSTTLTDIEGHRASYYPPELQDEYGSYDSSIDIFMFGVVMLQIAHRISFIKSQRERRELIQTLSDHHVLKNSIKWCTEWEKNKRPTASSIYTSVKSLLEEHKTQLELNPQDCSTNL